MFSGDESALLMNQQLLSFVHTAYVNSRRVSHSLLTRFPCVDRAIGDPLRLLTRRWEGKIVHHALANPLQVEGHLIFHLPEDAAFVSRLKLNAYEREVYNQILRILHVGMTMVDVGAHIGWYSLVAARVVGPNGRVYAFEAVPHTAETLQKNISINKYENIELIQNAVGNTVGKLPFYIDKSFSSSSSLFPINHELNAVEVETTTLDQFFQEEDWPPVHLVKLDIEGAEKLALDGMQELSRRNSSLKVIVEVNLRKFSLEELIDSLKGCGFYRFYALELGKTVVMPRDIPHILCASRSITVNLFCEK